MLAMQPLSAWPIEARRHLIGVFTDIDDTLTTEGSITSDALQALASLKAAGLVVIPITGRHIGWCEPLVHGEPASGLVPWPVDAIVAENGAVAFAPEISSQIELKPSQNLRKPLSKIYQQDAETRSANTVRMQQVAAQILRDIPATQLSRDFGGRETDLAFDYNEFSKLPPETVQKIVDVLQREGMHTTVSSIHVHGCYGNFNKWLGACWIVRELLGRDLAQELDRWVFVGDSGNDQAMFEHFIHSVGVANIHRFEASLEHLPHYVTASERGAGFAEVVGAIVQARAA
jgi:HAD superfamily hydrolase (TIGR01484 family)